MRSLIPSGRPIPGRLDREFDRMLRGFFGDTRGRGSDGPSNTVATRLEVAETEDEVVVRAEVPGVNPEDLDISIIGDVLTLSGEKRKEETQEDDATKYTERVFGSFRRDLRLSSAVELDQVAAEHKNGVVTIRLPKAAADKPRRIEVKSN